MKDDKRACVFMYVEGIPSSKCVFSFYSEFVKYTKQRSESLSEKVKKKAN